MAKSINVYFVRQLFKCEDCDRYITGSAQMEIHLKSQKHKRRLSRLARQAAALQTLKTTTSTSASEEPDQETI